MIVGELVAELEFDLPEAWVVNTEAGVVADVERVSGTPLVLGAAAYLTDRELSGVVATLFAVLTDGDDITSVVSASLVTTTVPAEALGGEMLGGANRIIHDVQIAPGISADFFQRTFIYTDSQVALSAILVFTSPNLTMQDELGQGFAEIAATARFVSRHDGGTP